MMLKIDKTTNYERKSARGSSSELAPANAPLPTSEAGERRVLLEKLMDDVDACYVRSNHWTIGYRDWLIEGVHHLLEQPRKSGSVRVSYSDPATGPLENTTKLEERRGSKKDE